jgi:hypothetical protein
MHITRQTLIDNGWTSAAITKFLGEPRIESFTSYRRRVIRYAYPAERVLLATQSEECRRYFAEQETKRWKREENEPKLIDLLDATREASRSAHRWRDRASDRWAGGARAGASTASRTKKYWYSLKERGIVALHQMGTVRYAGAAPQGMAVYEYGNGGKSCLHSTLHPVGAGRIQVDAHPEILFVPAKHQRFRLMDVEHTLESLCVDLSRYERGEAPTWKCDAKVVTCLS